MTLDKIPLDKNSRMLRIGFGKNEGRWFFRIDLWFAGYRIKKQKHMYKGKMIYTTLPKDYKTNGNDIHLGVYGIFNTEKVLWTYHVISYYNKSNGSMQLTDDICGRYLDATYDSVKCYGKRFDTAEEGRKFIEEYKVKWETGSNDTAQEIRDKKIGEILDGEES